MLQPDSHERVNEVVDEGLLVDAAHALHRAHAERILRSQVAGMLGLDLALGHAVLRGGGRAGAANLDTATIELASRLTNNVQ